MDIPINFEAFRASLLPYMDSLKNFNFSFLNPLFWISIFVLFLILLRFWQAKKSLFFCSMIAIILLATTKLEGLLADKLAGPAETFDPLLVRVLSCFIIMIIGLYYAFIRDE